MLKTTTKIHFIGSVYKKNVSKILHLRLIKFYMQCFETFLKKVIITGICIVKVSCGLNFQIEILYERHSTLQKPLYN